MSRRFPPALCALIFGLLISSTAASAATYYIAANGSDSNNGTSENTPWAHLPGMATWTGSHTPTAGDTFIFRGCDVWGNSNFPINWTWSGTSSNHITIDHDPTWYNTSSCSAWNRAIWDAQNAVIAPPECSNWNTYLIFGNVSYVDVNWIELRNKYWTSSAADASCYPREAFVTVTSGANYVTLNNFYIHAWTVASGAEDIDYGLYNSGCTTCTASYLVVDNSDGTKYTGLGVQWPTTHSIFAYVANALKPHMSGEYGYNDISHIAASISGVHPNCIETTPTILGSGNFFIHDNRIHDQDPNPGSGAGGCEGLQVGNPGETDYVWNNLFYNNTVSGANGPDLPQNSYNTVAIYYWNNTNVDSRSFCVSIANNGNKWSTAFVMQNNHCITTGTPSGSSQSGNMVSGTITGATTITFSNNIVESLSSANSKGYTNAQGYVYSPNSSSSETVGAGTNLTSLYWPAGFSIQDTTYACNEQTVDGVIQPVCPARTGNDRPKTGAWDVGAYLFPSSSGSAPNPPTGLQAVVQ